MPDNKTSKDKYKAPSSYQKGGKHYEPGNSPDSERYYQRPVEETANITDEVSEGANQKLANAPKSENPAEMERQKMKARKEAMMNKPMKSNPHDQAIKDILGSKNSR